MGGGVPHHGGEQHRRHGHIQQRVVQYPQQLQNHRHFVGIKVPLLLAGKEGHPRLLKGAAVTGAGPGGAAKQNAEVPGTAGPQPAPLADRKALVQHGADAPGDVVRLGKSLRLLHQAEFRLHAGGVGIGRPGVEPLPGGVVQVPELLGHAPGKDQIHPVAHLFSAAEVVGKENPAGEGLLLLVVPVQLSPSDKQFRGGPTEAVDGLLYVPHQKQVLAAGKVVPAVRLDPVRAFGQAPEQQVLHRADVLAFVHHHGIVFLAEPPAQIGFDVLLPFPADQKLHRHPGQIGKGVDLIFFFLGVQPPGKVPAQLPQGFHPGPEPVQVLGKFFPGAAEQRLQLLELL